MEKCLLFDLWGDYGHFRSIYTTSSPLTTPFPPKPTLVGIISAIVGLDKEVYLEEFNKKEFFIGLQLLQPVKKIRVTENYYNVKEWKPENRAKMLIDSNYKSKEMPINHTQIRLEFVKDPKYRIYFFHKDENIMNTLIEAIKNHSPYYTVTLGLSQNIANFEFVGLEDFKIVENNSETIPINTVIKKSSDLAINVESGLSIKIVNMPVEMDNERIVNEYAEYIYDDNLNPIKTNIKQYLLINNNLKISLL